MHRHGGALAVLRILQARQLADAFEPGPAGGARRLERRGDRIRLRGKEGEIGTGIAQHRGAVMIGHGGGREVDADGALWDVVDR